MFLHKHCKENHNIAKGCKTIRLGSLQEYREMDAKFDIADQWEGISKAGTNGDHITFSGEDLSKPEMSGPIITVGPNATKGTFTINGSMTVNIPNVHIFCVSYNDVNNSFSEYNSKYTIPDPEKFAAELLRLYIQQLKISDLEISDALISEIGQMQFQCLHRPVRYLKKPFDITPENKMEIMKIINNPNPVESYFTKADEKSDDQEYRFVLLPIIGKNIVSVKKEAKILNLEPFYKSIFDPETFEGWDD